MDIKIINKLSDIKKIIEEYDNIFDPSISDIVGDLDKYSTKLYKNALFIAVFYQNKVVGFASFYCNDVVNKIAYLSQIAVKKEYRGIGVSDMIISFVEKECIERKMQYLKLEVYNSNTNAINFYLKHGFKFTENASNKSKYMLKTL